MNVLSALALLFILASCAPDGEYGYEVWDADADEYILEDEFFNTWNEIGYYRVWDADEDNFLTEEEWETGLGNYYRNYDYEAYGFFDDWDLDGDGLLDENEFRKGTFKLWDENDDNRIELMEYDNWYYEI